MGALSSRGGGAGIRHIYIYAVVCTVYRVGDCDNHAVAKTGGELPDSQSAPFARGRHVSWRVHKHAFKVSEIGVWRAF